MQMDKGDARLLAPVTEPITSRSFSVGNALGRFVEKACENAPLVEDQIVIVVDALSGGVRICKGFSPLLLLVSRRNRLERPAIASCHSVLPGPRMSYAARAYRP
jgi:hypothetical protein